MNEPLIPDLDALERAAQAATNLDWEFGIVTCCSNHRRSPSSGQHTNVTASWIASECFHSSHRAGLAREYANACDPRTILALIALAREAETLRGRVIEECAEVAERTGRLHPLFADQILQKGIAAAIRSLK